MIVMSSYLMPMESSMIHPLRIQRLEDVRFSSGSKVLYGNISRAKIAVAQKRVLLPITMRSRPPRVKEGMTKIRLKEDIFAI